MIAAADVTNGEGHSYVHAAGQPVPVGSIPHSPRTLSHVLYTLLVPPVDSQRQSTMESICLAYNERWMMYHQKWMKVASDDNNSVGYIISETA